MHGQSEKIAALNDAFRTTGIGGREMVTSGFNAQSEELTILTSTRLFSADATRQSSFYRGYPQSLRGSAELR